MWGYSWGKSVWDSGLKIVKDIKIKVPLKILLVCKEIQRRIGYNEFSILVKGQWTDDGFELFEEYTIPEQEVTSNSVDYKENLEQYKAQGYNTVIHSHPWGGTDFSHADEVTINTHFNCSILFNGSEFVKAVISIQVNNNIKLQIPTTKIEIIYPTTTIPSEQLEKIKKKKTEIISYIDDFLL